MSAGWIRVKKHRHSGETLFEVHHWPLGDRQFYVCSSVCADREIARSNWVPGDAAAIGRRLAPANEPGKLSGEAKGRVLYFFDRAPLGGGYRVGAAALLHVSRKLPYQIYDFCLHRDMITTDQEEALAWLIRCAFRLAGQSGHRGGCIEVRVPADRDPRDMRDRYRLGEERKDQWGTWLKRCPVR
jgi:hypothetical protein